MKNTISLVMAAGIAAVGPTQAAETTAPVQVTATRTPLTADQALASVSVITREDIEERQPLDVPDLLADLPGVDISRNGGRGNTTSVNIRGTSNDQTLLLIDGVRVGSATTGGPALQNLSAAQIERIEVVRGPRASLYGADAIGGVIQVFTRQSDAAHASAGIGNRDGHELSAGIGRSGGQGFWSLNASRLQTDGFDVTDEGQPDQDGFEQDAVSVRGRYALTEALSVRGAAQYRDSEVEFDGFGSDGSDDTQAHYTVGVDWAVQPSWDLALFASRMRDDQDGRDQGGDRFITERREVTLQNDFYLSPTQTLTVGTDFRRDEVDGTTDFTEDSRTNAAGFVQHQWRPGTWSLELALRHDDNEAFGNETTGNAAVGYRFNDRLRGFASFGTGFKAPSFNDLFFPDRGFFSGNPDLEPERSRSWEAGLAGGTDWRWNVAAFYTEIDDLIVFDAASAQSVNLDTAEIKGIEGDVATRMLGFDVSANATWVDPRDEATDNRLPRRARLTVALDVSRRIGALELGGSVSYRGESFDDTANEDRLGAFALVDLDAAWHFTPQWILRGTVRNAADREYASTAGFNAPGRTAMLTLSWNHGGS